MGWLQDIGNAVIAPFTNEGPGYQDPGQIKANSIEQRKQRMLTDQLFAQQIFTSGNAVDLGYLKESNPEYFNQLTTQKEINARYSLLAQKPGKNPSVLGTNLGKNWGSLLG